jgi:SAM-dependent methyltransferase
LLRDGPCSADDLAAAAGADRHALKRLLTALSAIGLCARGSDDRYTLTLMGAALDGKAEHSFKAWAVLEGEMLSRSWTGLLDTVKTGKTAAELAGLANSFELMARSPENVAIFNAAMADLTRLVTPAVLESYDFSDVSHLMDVGGGAGEFVATVAKRYPRLHATVFDLPRCADAATLHLQSAGVTDRATFIAGDFFEAVPALADLILLKSVIHDWDDDRSRLILRNCRKALPPHGTLVLVERILPDVPSSSDEDKSHVMSDLNMMRGPGGCERTRGDYYGLLRDSGFEPKDTRPAGRFSVIDARPA